MMNYNAEINNAHQFINQQGSTWNAINPEYIARMRLQNRFKTGLDIANYTAKIMRDEQRN